MLGQGKSSENQRAPAMSLLTWAVSRLSPSTTAIERARWKRESFCCACRWWRSGSLINLQAMCQSVGSASFAGTLTSDVVVPFSFSGPFVTGTL
jgi:hypothetical protein